MKNEMGFFSSTDLTTFKKLSNLKEALKKLLLPQNLRQNLSFCTVRHFKFEF
jgi:hypothetical protein